MTDYIEKIEQARNNKEKAESAVKGHIYQLTDEIGEICNILSSLRENGFINDIELENSESEIYKLINNPFIKFSFSYEGVGLEHQTLEMMFTMGIIVIIDGSLKDMRDFPQIFNKFKSYFYECVDRILKPYLE